MLFAAGTSETALAFVEIGALILGLALLSRAAGRFGITAVPLYLIAGLAMGEGGVVQLDVSRDFFEITAEIGVLLLLFALGLEYSESELRDGLKTGIPPGLVDMALNALPGVALGLLLGWDPLAAVLLGGVTWISSSGVISKALSDFGRLGFRETPAVLNLLVIEDLAMAVYLPVVAALIVGGTVVATLTSVSIALVAVSVILLAALRYGRRISNLVAGGSDETFLLTVFGITLLVAGIAQQLEVSGAIGAFLVGLALSGQRRGTSQRADLATPRPVRRDVLPVLLVPDRPRRSARRRDPRSTPRRGHRVHEGRHRLVRGGTGRRRPEGPPQSRHRADRPRRVLHRDRRARLEPGQRPRTRRARCRLRADHGHHRAVGRKVRRPDPAADPAHAPVGSSSGVNALASNFGRWTDQISSPFAARTVRSS